MASHHQGISWAYLLDCVNVFLIRHPGLSIPSFRKHVTDPTVDDIGLHQQLELYQYLCDHGKSPLVISSLDLLQDPPTYLARLCDRLEIAFDDKMLHWTAGPRPEDGPWARYWYHSVHASTGWSTSTPLDIKVSQGWRELYETCMIPYTSLSHNLI